MPQNISLRTGSALAKTTRKTELSKQGNQQTPAQSLGSHSNTFSKYFQAYFPSYFSQYHTDLFWEGTQLAPSSKDSASPTPPQSWAMNFSTSPHRAHRRPQRAVGLGCALPAIRSRRICPPFATKLQVERCPGSFH